MNQSIFRQKNLERISSPEQLDDYLHVTTPAAWAVLLAVVVLLAGFFCWCSVTAVESYAVGEAVAQSGVLTITFDDERSAGNVEAGMNVQVGDLTAPVASVGKDESGRTMAIASLNMPDGRYDVRVGYKRTQIIDLLFN